MQGHVCNSGRVLVVYFVVTAKYRRKCSERGGDRLDIILALYYGTAMVQTGLVETPPSRWLYQTLQLTRPKSIVACQSRYGAIIIRLTTTLEQPKYGLVSCFVLSAAWRSGNGVGRINEVTLR